MLLSSNISFTFSQSTEDSVFISLKKISYNFPEHFVRLSFLSQSPITFFKEPFDENIESEAYRVLVTTSEIYNSIFIDRVVFGTETCCKRVDKTWEIDSFELSEKLELRGEFTGFKFIQWNSTNEFIFEIKRQRFIARIISSIGLVVFSQ